MVTALRVFGGVCHEMLLVVVFRWIFFLPLVVDFVVNQRWQGMRGASVKYTPVFLVHGYMQSQYNFWLMKCRLQRDGWKTVVYVPLAPFWKSIQASSPTLTRIIDETLRTTGQKQFIVIAHSIGGLVLKLALIEQPRFRDNLRCGIFLSTPHQANPLVRLGFWGECVDEMRPGNSLHESIRERTLILRDLNLWSMYSNIDWIVIGQSAREPLLDERNIQVPYVGHLSFLYSKRVYSVIRELLWLNPGPTATEVS